jgi:hypothetical protein
MTSCPSLVTRGTYERFDLSHRANRRHHGSSLISWIALGDGDGDGDFGES